MKSVFQTFLNVLLVVILATTPVTTVLAAVGSGNDTPMRSANAESCHHFGQKQGAADTHEKSPMAVPCTCFVDDCGSPDNAGCHHATASPLSALPTGSTEFPVMARDLLVMALQDSHTSLNLPPESPPPIV